MFSKAFERVSTETPILSEHISKSLLETIMAALFQHLCLGPQLVQFTKEKRMLTNLAIWEIINASTELRVMYGYYPSTENAEAGGSP